MYEGFYNLKAEPFRLSPDHRFCYDHKGYAKARAYMAYAYMRAEGFVMITGRPGTGKTTLIGELIESLADDDVKTANLVCTQLQADDLLKVTAYNFGVDHNIVEKGELLQQLGMFLQRWHRDGHRALLIVDEAQDLSESAMEELRLLTNIQESGKPLLQIFLLGQPELRDLVLSPSLEQVHQRIVAATHLEALEEDETEAYITHRLEKVGWQGDPVLSKTIFPLIYKFSEGVPRRINLICSRLFLHGCVEQRHHIGVADVREVIEELQSENLAAGTTFSEDDFELEDDFHHQESLAETGNTSSPDAQTNNAEIDEPTENLPEDSTSSGPADEEYLHAVGDEVVIQFDVATGKLGADNAKKKDDVVALRPTPSGSVNVTRTSDRVQHGPPGSQEVQSSGDVRALLQEQSALSDESKKDADHVDDDQPLPISNDPHPAPGPVKDLTSPTTAKDKTERQGSNGVLPILIILILAMLLVGWLIFRPSLNNLRDWQDQAGNWWQSLIVRIQPVSDVGQPKKQYRDIDLSPYKTEPQPLPETAFIPEPRPGSEPEAEAELLAKPQPEPEAELLPGSGTVPESETETQPDAEFAKATERETEPGLQRLTELPEPGSQDSQLSQPAIQPAEKSREMATPSNLQISFAFDSTSLSEQSEETLDELVKTLEHSGFSSIRVTGYADGLGDWDYNMRLSQRRAQAVAQYLVERGVDAGHLVVNGLGVYSDADQATWKNAGGEALNRRIVQVEVQIDELAR